MAEKIVSVHLPYSMFADLRLRIGRRQHRDIQSGASDDTIAVKEVGVVMAESRNQKYTLFIALVS